MLMIRLVALVLDDQAHLAQKVPDQPGGWPNDSHYKSESKENASSTFRVISVAQAKSAMLCKYLVSMSVHEYIVG
jgi:hypothetical protein